MNKIILLLSFMLMNSIGFAQSFTPVKNKAEFQNKLKASSANMKSVKADFSQLKFLSFMGEEVKSSGKFYFSQPNKVRWEYLSPSAYYIIINQNKIITYMNGSKNIIDASKNKTFSEINKIMLGSINGEIAQHEDFESELFENDENYQLKLKPQVKALKDVMSEIVIWFDKSNMSVSQIKMIEASGDYSLITLTNKKLNESISTSLFTP